MCSNMMIDNDVNDENDDVSTWLMRGDETGDGVNVNIWRKERPVTGS